MKERFTTTRWTLVLAARGGPSAESRKALAELCEAYWYPLYAFVRRSGSSADEAKDLTQGYFSQLLEKNYLRDVRPEAGRFRSFLLASIKNFIANERAKARTLKRGGHLRHLSLDTTRAEARYSLEPSDHLTPEAIFDRKWAVSVTQRALSRLRGEFHELGKDEQFRQLKPFLMGDEGTATYQEVSSVLGMSPGAIRVAVHRMRRRYGSLLREEIAQTVASPDQVDGELRHLLEVMGS